MPRELPKNRISRHDDVARIKRMGNKVRQIEARVKMMDAQVGQIEVMFQS